MHSTCLVMPPYKKLSKSKVFIKIYTEVNNFMLSEIVFIQTYFYEKYYSNHPGHPLFFSKSGPGGINHFTHNTQTITPAFYR